VPSGTPSEPVTVTVIPGSNGNPFVSGTGGSLSGSSTADVIGAQQNACPSDTDATSGFSTITPSGLAIGGSGSMAVSFSNGSFSGFGITVPYGPNSTPESIASHLAALITKQYASSGLTAQAYGANILYKGNATLGNANFTPSGSSFAADPAPAACPPANLRYVLAVSSDTVTWINVPGSTGDTARQVTYVIENFPPPHTTRFHDLTSPQYTNADITEHLTVNGYTSSNVFPDGVYRHAGQFVDEIGSRDWFKTKTGSFITDRWFSVIMDGNDLGHIMSYDQAGTHDKDHIKITFPIGPSILNNWMNSDGSPKDISLP
jgi:hypothetical protein